MAGHCNERYKDRSLDAKSTSVWMLSLFDSRNARCFAFQVLPYDSLDVRHWLLQNALLYIRYCKSGPVWCNTRVTQTVGTTTLYTSIGFANAMHMHKYTHTTVRAHQRHRHTGTLYRQLKKKKKEGKQSFLRLCHSLTLSLPSFYLHLFIIFSR